MITRIWPYGTQKQVEVIDVVERRLLLAVFCKELGADEGFICIYQAGTIQVEKGQFGTLTFKEGGPTGGYWDFEALKTN